MNRTGTLQGIILLFIVSTFTYQSTFGGPSRQIRSVSENPIPLNPSFLFFSPLEVDETDTLFYEDLRDSTYYFWTIPNPTGDRYYNVRFSPPLRRFMIWGVLIPLFDIPPRLGGPVGEPDLKVVVFESGSNLDGERGFPTEPIDSVIIPFESLRFNGYNPLVWNWINLRPLQIIFNDSVDFHIAVDMVGREGEHDTLAIFSDRGRLRPSNRSGVWSGPDSAWFKMANLPGVERGVNFFIRAVITDEDSLLYIIEPSNSSSPSRMTLISAYPNPFNAITTINLVLNTQSSYQLQLMDGFGRPLDWKQVGWGEGSLSMPLALPQMPSGIYFIQVSTPQSHQTIPIILTR